MQFVESDIGEVEDMQSFGQLISPSYNQQLGQINANCFDDTDCENHAQAKQNGQEEVTQILFLQNFVEFAGHQAHVISDVLLRDLGHQEEHKVNGV